MRYGQTIAAALYLAALGYLGLYFYGLFMGAYSPSQLVGFTVVAIGLGAVCAIHALRVHRAMRDPETHRELVRKVRHYRERRGF